MYYEVDCFWFLKNPYIPLDVSDPTLGVESQNDLVGDGRQEREEVVGKYEAVHGKEELTEEDKGRIQVTSRTFRKISTAPFVEN